LAVGGSDILFDALFSLRVKSLSAWLAAIPIPALAANYINSLGDSGLASRGKYAIPEWLRPQYDAF
jgi:hypothetical protein